MAASRTARRSGPSCRERPREQRLPLPARLEDRFQELSEAALSPAGFRHHEGLGPHFEGRILGSGGEADLGEDGQVVEVVSHVGDLRGLEALRAQDLLEHRPLVGDALPHHVQVQLGRASGHGGRVAAGQEADLQSGPPRQHHAQAVADVEGLGLAPVGEDEDPPVGEDAVHVREHEAERPAARGEGVVLGQIISVFQRSWRWTTPSTTPAASTTGRDVILRSSITARAAVARSRRRTVSGPGVMHCPAVWSSSA